MFNALQTLKPEHAFNIEVIDVDAHPELVDKYDELVPVLAIRTAEESTMVCHYFLDEARVRQLLSDAPA